MLRPQPIAWLSVAVALTLLCCFGGFDAPTSTPQKQAPPSAGADAGVQPTDSSSDAPKQSYLEAWMLICHAEQRSGADQAADRVERGRQVASWIVKHLQNKRARYWFINLRKIDKAGRRAAFLAEAKRAKTPDCPLADLLFPAKPSSQPAQ